MAIFTGTVANDSYLATTAGDNARGAAGNDTLIGNSGSDTLNGNADNDLLFADSLTQTAGGNDSLFGGQGNDTLVGARFGFSADSLGGNKDADVLIASTNGGNTLFGGQGDDTIYGSLSNGNTMNGDLGNDVLVSGRGNDRMLGANGNDTLIGGAGNNDMFGEVGNDEFQFFTAIPGDLTAFTGAEQVLRSRGGFGGSDTIFDFATGDKISISQLDRNATVNVTTNSAGAAVITIAGTASDGQPANQTITVVGVSRDALLAPGAQLLAINGQFITTNDTVNSDGTSTLTVGNRQPGDDIKGKSLVGSGVADSFSPESGVATTANGIKLLSTVNDDTLAGNGGNDFMDGGAGNDKVIGGDGDDTLIAGSGSDTLTGGQGFDRHRFNNFTPGEIDVITDYFGDFPLGDRIEISAKAFGGSLIPNTNGNISNSGGFFVQLAGNGVPAISTAPIGTSEIYYDEGGGGLYFDRDGAGTGTGFEQFAQLLPVPGFIPAPNVFENIIIVD